MANFKTTKWSFKSYDTQTKEEVARLENEYSKLQAIAADYKDRLKAIEPMYRSEVDIDNGSFEVALEEVTIAGEDVNYAASLEDIV